MKIGIIVFSKTGNTLSVAEKIKDKLTSTGHATTIEKITLTSGDNDMDVNAIRFGPLPNLDTYEVLIFASPVRAFSLAPAMKAYFATVTSLDAGKKTACFVTHFFPFSGMGAKQALAQMTDLIKSKGGAVASAGIVDWKNWRRNQQITGLVESMGGLFN